MAQQIIVIHGGTTFETYEQYIESLKEKDLTLEKIFQSDWKQSLQSELGPDFQIILPRMPNSNNAKYFEWEIWFNKVLSLVDEEVILIGHSLGGIFLAKYLSQNKVKVSIKKIIIIAAPSFNDPELVDFQFHSGFETINSNCEQIYLIYSQDDPVVNFTAHDQYKTKLPNSTSLIFNDRQHFTQSQFRS